MNANDIFRKSELGRQEIKNQSQGILPREARTLLILIDGKKTYQNYIDSLDNSNMFVEFGGVVPLFELLIDLQCIELLEQESTNAANQSVNASSRPIQPTIVNEPPASKPVASEQSVRSDNPPTSTTVQPSPNNEAEFEKAFNNQPLDNSTPTASTVSPQYPDANYESLKSDLATHIEKNAPPEEAWGYLLNLEQSSNTSELLALARNIQSSKSVKLARSMSDFLNRINRNL